MDYKHDTQHKDQSIADLMQHVYRGSFDLSASAAAACHMYYIVDDVWKAGFVSFLLGWDGWVTIFGGV